MKSSVYYPGLFRFSCLLSIILGASPDMNTMMEKMAISQVSTPVRSVDDQEVPNFSPTSVSVLVLLILYDVIPA